MSTKRPLLYLLTAITALALPACQQDSKQNVSKHEKPKPSEKNLNKMTSNLKASMVAYMQTGQPSYTMDDINTCETILKQYLSDIMASKSKKEGMEIVEDVVLRLNGLNRKTQETLIETDEREQIAEIIILAASRKGYNTKNEDITEEWREW